jgi:N-acetylglucosamine kinase-like BadF-type ATPase
MSELILGIDGGGSKTLAAIAERSGTIVETHRMHGVNPLDNSDWRGDLETFLAPLAGNRLTGVAAALPAYGEMPDVSAQQERLISDLFPAARVRLLNDVDAAQIGAFAGGPGILLLAGTGSMAWARDEAGRSHRTGGWGDAIGDEGSAYWIGKRVIGAVSKAIDGRGAPTVLTGMLRDTLGIDVSGMHGLEGWVAHLSAPRARIATLAPLVSDAAEAGDAVARRILDEAAAELALHVTTLERREHLEAPWSYGGGAFNSRALRDAVAQCLGRAPVAPRLPPIGGALLAAAQHLGWPLAPEFLDAIGASLRSGPAPTDALQLTTT